jgi:glucose/arabinose dehydrogenase
MSSLSSTLSGGATVSEPDRRTRSAVMQHRSCVWPACLVALVSFVAPDSAVSAASLPTGFAEALVAGGISSPTAMEIAPDGRIFVCEQLGRLVVIKNGKLLTQSFLNLTAVVDSTGERGLLGVAFDPNFATNNFVYVYYTFKTSPLRNRVSRFTANGDVAVSGSEVVILELDSLSSATNHNGGAIHFGPDGKLYVAVGDNANGAKAKSLSSRLGKILRINPDGSIPSNNPFYTSLSGVYRAIWAYGLRNPFTFAFQPGTGRMFINDVGQDAWEEINDGIAGSYYGWPDSEGETTLVGTRSPLLAYGHGTTATTGCAITGGAFYNPAVASFPSTYVGRYFFADYCRGWIRVYNPATDSAGAFATGITRPVDLRVAADGRLYYLARGSGSTTGGVYRVSYTASQAPSITTHPASQTVPAGGSVTFSVSASGTTPLSYQWQRNGANLSGATASSYTIAAVSAADSGATFRAVVSNAFGSATSNAATLTVTSNTPPTGTISAPTAGTLYRGGDTISYAGSGTDAQDGTLPASAFTWEIVFHHDTHTHPFIPPTSGSKSGSFVVPTLGHTESNVWYRIHLTVRDSGGLTHASYVDVRPRTVTLQLNTVPTGLQITLDDQPKTAPLSVVGVVGVERKLGVVSPQSVSGTPYVFRAWSDGGAATHTISTPDTATTYTASYVSELWLEAESGVRTAPMIVASDTAASGSQYVHVPNANTIVTDPTTQAGGRVTYTVTLPAAGTYVIWGQVRAASGGDDSFWVSIDGGPFALWEIPVASAWVWDEVNNRGVADPVLFSLTAGTHTLVVKQREDGAQLDRLLIAPASYASELWLEAESGVRTAPMTVASDTAASGGQYVHVPNAKTVVTDPTTQPGGQVTYTVTLPTTGTYVIWGRVRAGGGGDDSFWVSIDGGPFALWEIPVASAWVWDEVNNRGVADPVLFSLTAGTHTVVVKQREDGAQLDRLLITSDLAFVGP